MKTKPLDTLDVLYMGPEAERWYLDIGRYFRGVLSTWRTVIRWPGSLPQAKRGMQYDELIRLWETDARYIDREAKIYLKGLDAIRYQIGLHDQLPWRRRLWRRLTTSIERQRSLMCFGDMALLWSEYVDARITVDHECPHELIPPVTDEDDERLKDYKRRYQALRNSQLGERTRLLRAYRLHGCLAEKPIVNQWAMVYGPSSEREVPPPEITVRWSLLEQLNRVSWFSKIYRSAKTLVEGFLKKDFFARISQRGESFSFTPHACFTPGVRSDGHPEIDLTRDVLDPAVEAAYKVLGFSDWEKGLGTRDREKIRKAYREKMRLLHPDRVRGRLEVEHPGYTAKALVAAQQVAAEESAGVNTARDTLLAYVESVIGPEPAKPRPVAVTIPVSTTGMTSVRAHSDSDEVASSASLDEAEASLRAPLLSKVARDSGSPVYAAPRATATPPIASQERIPTDDGGMPEVKDLPPSIVLAY